MALANLAECLYRRGARVVMIDWDLEAPGLEQFFCESQAGLDDVRSQLGVIDMLLDYKRRYEVARPAPLGVTEGDAESHDVSRPKNASIFETVKPNLLTVHSLLYPIHPPQPRTDKNTSALWLLPAGWRSTGGLQVGPGGSGSDRKDDRFSKYAEAVQSFDWADFYSRFEGEAYFNWLREQLLPPSSSSAPSDSESAGRLGVDAVLIDSRTGVTEMGGVCTRQLADVVVSFCAPNYQNLEGVVRMTQSFLRDDIRAFRGGSLPEVVVVPARVDILSETDETNRFRDRFNNAFKNQTGEPEVLSPTFEEFDLKMWDLLIPYIAKYGFRESLTVGAADSNQTLEKAYWELATRLVLFAEKESKLRVYFAADLQKLAPTEQVSAEQVLTLPGYGLYLSYNSKDRTSVVAVQKVLEARGIANFFDRDNFPAGLPWPEALDEGLRSVSGVAVFIGRQLGEWQKREMAFALDRQVREEKQGRSFPVIPVLLPGADLTPGFLFNNTWVDLRGEAGGPTTAKTLDGLERALNSGRPGQVSERAADICPYRGLQVFGEEDAAFFFGRSAFVQQLFQFILGNDLVAIVGPSGSGKSSAVQAGLLPLLRRVRPPAETWDAVAFTPGNDPFYRLASALTPLLNAGKHNVTALTEAEQLGANLAGGQTTIESVIRRVIDESNGTGRLLLVVDQFEELFTLTPEPSRRPFAQALLRALGSAPFKLLLTLRADFYDQTIALDRDLSDRLASAQVIIGALTQDELRESITAPAKLVGLEFEPGLVERILADVGSEPGRLPLLEFALTELWQRRERSRMVNRAYDEIGGVTRALAQRAEAEFARLKAEEKMVAHRLFSRLVLVGEEGEDRSQHIDVSEADPVTQQVVRTLADARLVVTSVDFGSGKPVVGLAHEALIRNWERLRGWLNEDREFLLWRQRLQVQVKDWQGHGQDAGYLLGGAPVSEAERWLLGRPQDLTSAEQQLIQGSIALREQKQYEEEQRRRAEIDSARRHAKRFRRLSLALGGMLCLAVAASVYALLQRNWALESEAQARMSAEFALRQSAQAQSARVIGTSVLSASWSPDGTRVATGSQAGTANVWDAVRGKKLLTLSGQGDSISSVAGARTASGWRRGAGTARRRSGTRRRVRNC